MDKSTKTAIIVGLVAYFMARDLQSALIMAATAFAADYLL